MPQESKSKSGGGDSIAQAESEERDLQGAVPELASEEDVRAAMEDAFDYRGDITLALNDGSVLEGYLFDRDASGETLEACRVRLFPKDRDEKVSVSFADIARIEFSGKDTAAGKSFERWMERYRSKKVEEARRQAGG